MNIDINGQRQLHFWRWLLKSRLSFRFKDQPDISYVVTMLDWNWIYMRGQVCVTVVL